MYITVAETQVVGEVESTLFSLIQAGPCLANVIIKNTGSNIINYRFQSFDGTNWNDMDQPGTPRNGTLALNQVVAQVISSVNSQIRLVGSASGGSDLDFDITRFALRADGGALPILNL